MQSIRLPQRAGLLHAAIQHTALALLRFLLFYDCIFFG